MAKAVMERNQNSNYSDSLGKLERPYRPKKNTKAILRRAVECLEPRRLLSALPQPTLEVSHNLNDPDNSVILTYSAISGSHLELERETANDQNFQVDRSLSNTIASNTITITDLAPGTTYQYRVRADDKEGNVAYSDICSIDTPYTGEEACNSVPISDTYAYWKIDNGSLTGQIVVAATWAPEYSAPMQFHFVAQIRVLGGCTDTWNIYSDDFTRITSYTANQAIQWDETSHDPYVPSPSYYLSTGMNIQYRVYAYTDSGDLFSGFSDWKTLDGEGPTLPPPTNFHLTTYQNSTTFEWNPVSESNFEQIQYILYGVSADGYVDVLNPIGVTTSTSLTKYTSSLSNYSRVFVVTYGVQDFNGLSLPAESTASEKIKLNPASDVPAAPANLSKIPQYVKGTNQYSVALLWDNTPNNETTYQVQRAQDVGFTQGVQSWTVSADTSLYVDKTINHTVANYYRVKAINSHGESVSNVVTIDPATTKYTPVDELPKVTPNAPKSPDPVRYSDGLLALDSSDLSSDSMGGWSWSRSWAASSAYSLGGTNGNRWMDLDLPWLQANDDGSVYVVNGGQGMLSYNLVAGSYVADYYVLDTLTHDDTTHLFTFKSTDGSVYRFYDFDSFNAGAIKGRLKDFTDAAGNTTTANYNTTSFRLDSLDRAPAGESVVEQFLFTYVPDSDEVNAGLIASVSLVHSGNSTPVQTAEYTYYDGTTSGGNARDLAFVTIKDGAGTVLDKKYYRYYKDGDTGGFEGYLKYSVSTAQYAALKTAAGGDDSDVLAASDSLVAQYSDIGVTYDNSGRVDTEAIRAFGDSTQGNGIGTEKFEYETSTNPDGYNSWKAKTTEYLPDNTPTDWLDNDVNIVYTNTYGQAMLTLTVDRNGTDSTSDDKTYADFYAFDDKGHTVLHANPSAITDYDPNKADLMNKDSNGHYQYLSNDSGLIETSVFELNSTTANGTPDDLAHAGNVIGYLKSTAIQKGDEPENIVPQSSYQYYHYTANGSTINLIASSTVYSEDDETGARETTYRYGLHPGTIQIQWQEITQPGVTTDQNGPGTTNPDVSVVFYDTFGRVIWTKDATGHVNKTVYDDATGGIIQTIKDVDSATISSGDLSLLNSAGVAVVSGGLNLVTDYEVDDKGRTTKQTDPNRNICYIVYNDAAHEVRSYSGWTGTTATGPITITREVRNATPDSNGIGGRYTETITSSATPTVSGGKPTGQETIDASNILSLSRSLMNTAGQVVETDDYFSIPTTYSTSSPRLGSASNDSTTGNYHATTYGYDGRGRQNRVQDATGTITRYVYDALDRLVSTWIGTDDSPTTGYWSPSNTTDTNLVKVSENEYDNGGVGDSNLTKTTTYPSGSTTPRVSQMYYDWRDRMVASKSAVQSTELTTDNTHFINYVDYDNLGEVTASYTYDGDTVSISYADGVPQNPLNLSLLKAMSTAKYDEQGRVYESMVVDPSSVSIDPNTGLVKFDQLNGLVSKTWYDKRGYVIKTSAPGGLVSKSTYDGAGRTTDVYTTDGGGDNTWADAGNVTSDIVLEQIDYTYDANGNIIQTARRQRFDDATGTGALGDANSTSQPKARVYYAGSYYDALNRDKADVSVGTNVTSSSGVAAWSRPTSVPTRSDNTLVTSYTYNDAGYLDTVTDAKGIVSKNYYDALGRTTETIAAYTDGTPTDSTNQTTDYTYDGSGHVLTMTAVLPDDEHQTTEYIYGVSQTDIGRGMSDIDSNDILSATYYPDTSTGDASSSSAESQTINALGQVTTSTDRNGTTHTYTYDVLGRTTSDTVTTPGSGVDTSIRRLGYTYDSAGLAYQSTSYSDTVGTTVVNQVQRQYNGYGQLLTEYQAHTGAVNTSTTPKVQYVYDSDHANRISRIINPDGSATDYDYGGTLNDSINRLTAIYNDDDGICLAQYAYMGLDTVILELKFEDSIGLDYRGSGLGDGGDQYIGLDRFGRIIDQKWINNSNQVVDEYVYSYDRNSNVTVKENKLDATKSETYTYDSLNRLIESRRGTLDSYNHIASPTRMEIWGLDALGNWDTHVVVDNPAAGDINLDGYVTGDDYSVWASHYGKTNATWTDGDLNGDGLVNGDDSTLWSANYGHTGTAGSVDDRTHNAQNELTQTNGSTLTYDANGNMTTNQNGHTLVYDAWNHLKQMNTGSTTIATYSFDALGRRITDNTGTATELYYSGSQIIEEQQAGVAKTRYVWGPNYINDLVSRYRDADGNSANGLEELLIPIHDANHNTTALTNAGGPVIERFQYDPYGHVTVLNANWSTSSATAGNDTYKWTTLFQGMRYDAVADLSFSLTRAYSAELGRWISQDPARYIAGANLYGFVGGNAVNLTDSSGLCPDPEYQSRKSIWESNRDAVASIQAKRKAALRAGRIKEAQHYQEQIRLAEISMRQARSLMQEAFLKAHHSPAAMHYRDQAEAVRAEITEYIESQKPTDAELGAAYLQGAAEGAKGGTSIVVNTMTLGKSDEAGWTNSDQYQGSMYDGSRTMAKVGTASIYLAGGLVAAEYMGITSIGSATSASDLYLTAQGELINLIYTGSTAGIAGSAAKETRTVLAGHGGFIEGDGSMIVPEGTSITVWTDPGNTITDGLGVQIECGIVPNAENIIGARTYLPGAAIPNYTLFPPDNIHTLSSSTTVTSPTSLSDLVSPNQGNVSWAACLLNIKK